jgi:DNA polymerase elongation subunit (family B)
MKGIDAVRRDRTKMVRDLSEQLLQHLLVENDPKSSLDLLEKRIADILDDRVNVEDFVLSKSLKGS